MTEPLPETDESTSFTSRLAARADTAKTKAGDWLDAHSQFVLIDLGRRLFLRDREAAGSVLGSAIAFRMFLFFVPFVLFVVGVMGFLSSFTDADSISETTGVAGTMSEQINAALEQSHSTRWFATILGLFGMATAGRSLSRVMATASTLTWQLPRASRTSMRLVGAIVGLVSGIGVVSVIVSKLRAERGVAIAGMSFLIALAVYAVAWLLVSMSLPRATSDPSVLLPGAVLVATTLAGMQAFSQLYLPGRFDRASELYGAVGTTIVTLGWFFIFGRVIVIGMALNAVVYERYQTIARLVFALPVLRILARHSPRLRKFFNLDRDDSG